MGNTEQKIFNYGIYLLIILHIGLSSLVIREHILWLMNHG
jgi:hypothetical protein